MDQNDKIKQLADSLKQLSKTENYQINILPDITPEIFDSKLGGLSYWTPDKKYPTNSDGKKLLLLAQINFDRENVDSPLPTNGLLQFFITDDIHMAKRILKRPIRIPSWTRPENFIV